MRFIRTKIFLAVTALGMIGLPIGCGGGGKSNEEIPNAPEARNASQAIADQYTKQYSEKFAKKKGRP
jgi:hypothetical protein